MSSTTRYLFGLAAILAMFAPANTASALQCKNTQATTKVCVFDHVCTHETDQFRPQWPTYSNGRPTCPEGYILEQVLSVTKACELASAGKLESPPKCAAGCTPGGLNVTSKVTDAKCCTKTTEQTCTAP